MHVAIESTCREVMTVLQCWFWNITLAIYVA